MRTLRDMMGKRMKAVFCGLLGLLAATWMMGCDDPSDNGDFDYVPPSGYGAMIVDNRSLTDINVYVDGVSIDRLGDGSDRHYDIRPGAHRIVLDENDGGRRWSGDIDILDARLTILRVAMDIGDSNDYRVSVEFD